ncbi:MAG: lytic transglycosylase domain-containing protein, partial [Bacteroidetes bacterium]
LFAGSHALTFWLSRPQAKQAEHPAATSPLYLMDRAAVHILDTAAFGRAVRQVARDLQVPPAWLMAVMYAESGFDPAVANRQGSGAVGLIQFMPATARELGTSSAALSRLTPHDQLGYVGRYLAQVQARYGPYQSLTDLYLAVLYPRARGQDPCYALYARPSRAYRQNQGLDENGDGIVTVSDIDQRLARRFPEAYVLQI